MLVETEIQCAYCNEVYSLLVDTSQGDHSLTEDCTVCCRPLQLLVRCEPGEIVDVEVARG